MDEWTVMIKHFANTSRLGSLGFIMQPLCSVMISINDDDAFVIVHASIVSRFDFFRWLQM